MVRTGATARALAAAGLVIAFSSQAQADDFTSATKLLNDYNVIVLGNVTENSEMDGKAFIGGSLSGSGNFDTHNVESSAFPALTVGGAITATNLSLNGVGGLIAGSGLSSTSFYNNGKGNIYVNGDISNANNLGISGFSVYATGNLVSSSVSVNNSGSNLYLGGKALSSQVTVNGSAGYSQNSSVPASVVPNVNTVYNSKGAVTALGETAEAQTSLTNYSKTLNSLTANNTVTESAGTLDFNVSKTTNGVAVFDLNSNAASLLNNATQMEFSLNGAKEVVINVSGVNSTALNINANFLNGIAQSLGTNTIWNFTDATSIKIGAQFGGDILATMANLTTSGNIEGTVVANSLVQNAEIHYDGVQTHLVSAVPLPGAALLFGSAITGFGLFGRRRRKQSR
jgi:choice-of-anchor A domain-containing protein